MDLDKAMELWYGELDIGHAPDEYAKILFFQHEDDESVGEVISDCCRQERAYDGDDGPRLLDRDMDVMSTMLVHAASEAFKGPEKVYPAWANWIMPITVGSLWPPDKCPCCGESRFEAFAKRETRLIIKFVDTAIISELPPATFPEFRTFVLSVKCESCGWLRMCGE